MALDIEAFVSLVRSHLAQQMQASDAIELAGAITGGTVAQKVSHAVSKYKEASYERTPLFSRPDQDRIAILSMGYYWEPHLFEEGYPEIDPSEEARLAEAIYLLLRHPQESLASIVTLSELLPGDHTARLPFLEALYGALSEPTT